jgi:hypothetical protein
MLAARNKGQSVLTDHAARRGAGAAMFLRKSGPEAMHRASEGLAPAE